MTDIDTIIAGLRAKAAKAKSMQTGVALGDALSLADEVVRLREENGRLGYLLRIAQELCDSIRESESKLKTRLIEGTNA